MVTHGNNNEKWPVYTEVASIYTLEPYTGVNR